MIIGHFYFLKPEYSQQFANPKFMNNNEHNRPYFCAFTDGNDIYWLIPISSKVDKFERIYNDKIKRYANATPLTSAMYSAERKPFLFKICVP